MGGLGSGNRIRMDTKATVGQSLDLGMKNFRNSLYQGAAGTITWTWTSGRKSSIGYSVTGMDRAPSITLEYRWRDTEEIRMSVHLESTPTQFGGIRWWFTCQLIVRGVACNRRAGKLYLPPGAKYFGCRECHDLSYRSSQEAHQIERALARMGFGPEIAKIWEQRNR
jgi:hypothetical protein